MITLTDIPANLQTDFLIETVSDTEPALRREGGKMIFPAFVRLVDGVYRYFEVPCAYTGQDCADYDACALAYYADLRRHFYGAWATQLEQQLKMTFAGHQYAVKAAFPKPGGESATAEARFEAIKANFWDLVDAACAAVGKSRIELPETFNAEVMMALAVENGMGAAEVADYTAKFSIVSLNLLQNGRNWKELFE